MGRKKLGRVKRNITLPPALAERADRFSVEQGRTLSSLIEEALNSKLPEARSPKPPHAPRK